MNIKKFDIEAIPARVVYNKYGDHDPDGKMYVLKKYKNKIEKLIEENSLVHNNVLILHQYLVQEV